MTVPLIVPNTLWQAADPAAYDGGRESDITHLREFEASGLGRRDDARWGGVLEVIPTKADYVLDLIRMNSLWPLLSGPGLLRHRDDVDRDVARTTSTAGACSRSGPARARPTSSSSPAR